MSKAEGSQATDAQGDALAAVGVAALVRGHLLRRLSAPRRLGTGYRLVRLDTTADTPVTDWLPADLLGRFPPSAAGGA